MKAIIHILKENWRIDAKGKYLVLMTIIALGYTLLMLAKLIIEIIKVLPLCLSGSL